MIGSSAVDARRVLFVSHNASRTGAPFLLLQILRWLRENTNWELSIVLRQSGPLRAEFEAIGPTFVFEDDEPDVGVLARPWRRLKRRLRLWRQRRRLRVKGIELVYSNTATNGAVLDFLSVLNCPVVSNIHELEHDITTVVTPGNRQRLFERTDYFIAGSDAARVNLLDNHGVEPRRVETVHDFISVAHYPAATTAAARLAIRAELGIDERTTLVCAAGTDSWRKGPDLFVQLAVDARRIRPDLDLHFLWVGADKSSREYFRLQHDVQHANLAGKLTILPATDAYLSYIQAADIFSLMSREDCFPLVMLEAALYQKPIVCFDGSGGAPEFVKPDAGYAVPYLDTHLLALRVLELAEDQALRATLGSNARKKVMRDHDVANMAPRLMTVIDRLVTGSAGIDKSPGHLLLPH